jgi:hypothetical protein
MLQQRYLAAVAGQVNVDRKRIFANKLRKTGGERSREALFFEDGLPGFPIIPKWL